MKMYCFLKCIWSKQFWLFIIGHLVICCWYWCQKEHLFTFVSFCGFNDLESSQMIGKLSGKLLFCPRIGFESVFTVYTIQWDNRGRMCGVRDPSIYPVGKTAVCDPCGVSGCRGSLLPGRHGLIGAISRVRWLSFSCCPCWGVWPILH